MKFKYILLIFLLFFSLKLYSSTYYTKAEALASCQWEADRNSQSTGTYIVEGFDASLCSDNIIGYGYPVFHAVPYCHTTYRWPGIFPGEIYTPKCYEAGECPAGTVWTDATYECIPLPACPDGTEVPDGDVAQCPPVTCSDGTTVPNGEICPANCVGIECVSQKAFGTSDCSNSIEGNPCDASTVNKFQSEVDYTSNSLNFIRYYISLDETQSVLGKQWTHHYLASLTISESIKVNRHDGKVLEFYNDLGNWVSDADIIETLTQVGSNWIFKTSDDSIESYNNNGQLLSIKSRNGKVTQFTYNANGLLEQVTGHYGRTFGFSYDVSNRLITLTTAENTQIQYSYDDVTNNLISVTYPDDTPGDLNDNPGKIYHYEDTNFPHHLTGITDENNIRYASWAYNDSGLVILSEHANSAEKVDLVYNLNETTTVTDALGRIKTYTFENYYGLRKPSSIQYDYHDGTQAVTKSKIYTYYPENGQVKEINDYNGNVTYFEYNSRGLVTLKTQAKDTPEQYTVTTSWHPEYRLPESRTYPDRTETYSYDSNGRLIKTHTSSNL